MDRDQIAALLQQAHLFRGADPRTSSAWPRSSTWCRPHRVSTSSSKAIIATEFFVLARGKVRIYIPGHGDELDLGIVGDGQMFGEGGLFDGGPRVASAVALEPSTILRIPRDEWLLVVDEIPEFTRRMLFAIGASVRQYTSHAIDFLFLDVEIPSFPPEEDAPPG